MNKSDFEKIFKEGFNKEKIYYEDAQNGESELRCFKCNHQAGFGYVYIKVDGKYRKLERIICVHRKSHAETLINYTARFVEMQNDLLECDSNNQCILTSE